MDQDEDFDSEDFEMQVLYRRRSGMLFEIFCSKSFSSVQRVKLPVSIKCGYSQENLTIPIRNIGCYNSQCIWELEHLLTILSVHCTNNKTYVCSFCKNNVNLKDYYYDVDIAYYSKLLPEDVQLYIDKDGNFSANILMMNESEQKDIIKQLKLIQPLNPHTTEKIDLDYLANSISQYKEIFNISERNISHLDELRGDKGNIHHNNRLFNEELEGLLRKKITLSKTFKRDTERLFTFQIGTKSDFHSQIYLYYPAFNKWYIGELYHLNENKFKIIETACQIVTKSGSIFLIGGVENGKISRKIYEVKIKLDEKNRLQKFYVYEKNSMPQDHLFYQYCEIDDMIYIMMGLYTDWNINKDLNQMKCCVYNTIKNEWNEMKCAKYERAFGSACSTNHNLKLPKKIYLFGGLRCETTKNTNSVREIEEYDFKSCTWTTLCTINRLIIDEIRQNNIIFYSNTHELILFGGNFIMNKGSKTGNYTFTLNIVNKGFFQKENLPDIIKMENKVNFPYNYVYFNGKVYIYMYSTELEINQNCLVYDMNSKVWVKISKESMVASTVSNSEIKFTNF